MADPIIPSIVSTPDINRSTTNVALPAEVSAEIWAKTLDESVFMRLARRITLPGPGVTVQTITGEPVADWVDEADAKPVSTHSFGKKPIKPYKLAVIEPFSMEFARDKAALYAECVRRLPKAIAAKFDATIMGTTAPGTGFDVLGNTATQGIAGNTYGGFIAAEAAIAANGGMLNGIGLAPQGRSIVLGAVDGNARPLFNDVHGREFGSILGANVAVAKALYAAGSPNVVGIAGDWDGAVYGIVEGIKLEVSREATLVTDNGIIALWQQNMFAVRVEAEVGFAVKDAGDFVRLTDATVA